VEEEKSLKDRIMALLEGDSDPQLEEELPYASMMITLMAASGITPYESFKRMRNMDVLEKFKAEGEEIVRLVEVLGYDPLTAMEKRAEETVSRQYADFLEGYISSVKSGGSVINYLMSKMKGIFDVHAAKAQNAIERLETLVEAYMVLLIIVFCVYILTSVTSTNSTLGDTGLPDTSGIIPPLVLVVIPVFSLFFMYLANNARRSTLRHMREPYIAGAIPMVLFLGAFLAINLLPQFYFVTEMFEMPLIVTAGLVGVCIPPTIVYQRIAKKNFDAEAAMPNLLRDVTEARRTGLSPEKSIVHAAGRRGYGAFTENLRRMINQLEWGVSLRKIYLDLQDWVKSWPVVVNFYILVETIEIGGGDADTLGILAEFSEKSQTIQKSQNDMLTPYVILPFMWTILMVFTVTFTTQTLNSIPVMALGSMAAEMSQSSTANNIFIESGIIFHSWLSGFFIGKVSTGNFASGFKYSALLALTAFVTLVLSKGLVMNFIGGMF
jgi:flagellar protein FlaJ